MNAGDSLLAGCRNIWDYIQLQQIMQNQSLNLQQEHIFSSEGIYFKYKDDKINTKQDSKKLQVFSQTINTGEKSLVITTIRDMSHWIELERQKNLTLFKTQAFASAAHEFRNPLGAIITSLELIKNHIDMDKVGQFYMTAKNCSNLLLFLVNDILDYSQLESKKIQTNKDNVCIEQTIRDCIEVLSFKAQSKNLELSYLLEDQIPKKLMTDQNRLRQILINLISNAIKYTHTGYVKVKVSQNEVKQKLLIQVEDTGVGICKEDQEKLFNAYVKIKNNRNLNKDGCGLGLTICKNLAEALGGKIKMQSEIGQGSTFTLKLPIQYSDLSYSVNSQAYLNLQSRIFTYQHISIDENSEERESQNFTKLYQVNQQQLKAPRSKSFKLQKNQNAPQHLIRRSTFYNKNSNIRFLKNNEVNFVEDSETNLRKELAMNLKGYLDTQELLFSKDKSQLMADDFDEGIIDLQQVRFDINQKQNYSAIQTVEMTTPQYKNKKIFLNSNTPVPKNNSQEQQNNLIEIQSASDCSSQQAEIVNSQQILLQFQQNQEILGFNRQSQNIVDNSIGSNKSRSLNFQRASSYLLNNRESTKTQCNHAKILIVDDDPFNLLILDGMLQQLKITQVDKCYDGLSALKKMDENFSSSFDCSFHTPGRETCCKSHKPYQLVIVDNQMPQMSGLQVAQEIRIKQRNGELPEQLKVMLLSGDDRLLRNAEAQKVFDFIHLKPINLELLNKILENIEL
eukprot:403351777